MSQPDPANHNAILGPTDNIICMPDHMQKLDFELEAAIVIGKKGRNVKAKNADNYIAGYLIMNDMSARALQMEEMKLNLGPAKGKDFCTIIGAYLVTKEELDDIRGINNFLNRWDKETYKLTHLLKKINLKQKKEQFILRKKEGFTFRVNK